MNLQAYLDNDVKILFFKSFIAAHTRKTKDGKIIQVAAYSDKRLRKDAQSVIHNKDINHLSEDDRANWARLHQEQHVLHHVDKALHERRIKESEANIAQHNKKAAHHEEQRDIARAKGDSAALSEHNKALTHHHNRAQAWANKRAPHQRQLAKVNHKLDGIKAMKEKLWAGSGEVGEKDKLKDTQESPETFIKAPDGSFDFGEITPEISKLIKRQAGKIRLQVGIESDKEKYGIAHIETGHKKEIESLGYSVADFVLNATRSPDEIRQGNSGSLIMVKKVEGKDNITKLVFVRLKPLKEGDFYCVETAFVKPVAKVAKDYPLLWRASVPHPTDSSYLPPSATASTVKTGEDRSTGTLGQSKGTKSIAQPGKKASVEKQDGKAGKMSVDNLITTATQQGRSGNDAYSDYREVNKGEADALNAILKKDVSGYKHSMDESAIRHILKEHGESATELPRGQIGITAEDFKKVPEITNATTADSVEYGGKSEDGLDKIVYKKRYNGNFIVVEEVRNGRGKLALKTLWKTRTVLSATSEEGGSQTSKTFHSQSPTGNESIAQTDGKASQKAVPHYVNDDYRNQVIDKMVSLLRSGNLSQAAIENQLSPKHDINEKDYPEAVKAFLEGDLSHVKPPKKADIKLYSKDITEGSITPQLINKGIKKVGDGFRDTAKALLPIMGKDDVRGYLNGIHVDHKNNRLVATNGNMLAIIKGIPDDTPVIPGSFFNNKAAVLSRSAISGQHDDSHWLDAKIPDFSRVLEDNYGDGETLNTKDLSNYARGAIKAMSFMGARYNPLMITVGKESFVYDANYVKDIMDLARALGYDSLTVKMGKKSQVLFESEDGKAQFILMPTRVDDSPIKTYDPRKRQSSLKKSLTLSRPLMLFFRKSA
jgi:hypothetical protein